MGVLKDREISIPLVMLTGHAMEEELEPLRLQGMIDWLPKPPSLEDLGQVVARAIESAKST